MIEYELMEEGRVVVFPVLSGERLIEAIKSTAKEIWHDNWNIVTVVDTENSAFGFCASGHKAAIVRIKHKDNLFYGEEISPQTVYQEVSIMICHSNRFLADEDYKLNYSNVQIGVYDEVFCFLKEVGDTLLKRIWCQW